MLRPNASDLKVYLHRAPIDMRRGRNGLAAIVREVMQQDPFQPAFFLFINKRFNALKLLTWDINGGFDMTCVREVAGDVDPAYVRLVSFRIVDWNFGEFPRLCLDSQPFQ